MKTSFLNTFQRDFFSDLTGGTAQAGANAAAPGSGVVLGLLGSLFANKPNPNDWKGWDAQDSQNNRPPGTSVAWWIITDGDSVQNEALNAISYMRTKTQGVQKVYDAALEVYGLDETAFTAKLVDKLKRAGYPNEAAQFASSYNSTTLSSTTQPIPLNQPGAATPIGQNNVHVQMPNPTNGYGTFGTGAPSSDTTAAMQATTDKNKKTWLIVGIVGGVIVLAGIVYAVVKLTGKGK